MARNHYGTDNADVIHGTSGHWPDGDAIWAYGGDDEIYAGNGWDYITGGAGADYIDGGGAFDQAIYADSPVAVMVFLYDSSTYGSGLGYGGTAEGDVLVNIENLAGSEYDDLLSGDSFRNELYGRNGQDTLKGGGGYDRLSGDGGNDVLIGGTEGDYLHGGSGYDTSSYTASSAGVVVSLITDSAAYGDAQGDELDSIENLTGSNHADTLIGENGMNVLDGLKGNDTLKGYGGHDTLKGGDGNDFMDGGAGYDSMYGGLGNDTYLVDSLYDYLVESGGQGFDVVRTSTNFELTPGADIERLETSDSNGTTNLLLYGNDNNNEIVGNAGHNIIDGKVGTDQLRGLAGNDTYIVDNAGDVVRELGGQGADQVYAYVSWTMTAGSDIETLLAVGANAVNLTGNETNNRVTGNNANNVINGGAGGDELTGLGGQDSFRFDTALSASNVDSIIDFNVADDTIQLSNTVFSSSLGLGNISASEFVIGAAAQDANDRIIYNSSTGGLFYDADGVGGNAQVQFAQLSTGLGLTNLDFLVVSGTQIPSFSRNFSAADYRNATTDAKTAPAFDAGNLGADLSEKGYFFS